MLKRLDVRDGGIGNGKMNSFKGNNTTNRASFAGECIEKQ
jgi:hypothetical protein